MSDFKYQPIVEFGTDKTEYRLLSKNYVKKENWGGRDFLVVDPKGIEMLTKEAFSDVSHLLRPSHMEKLGKILNDSEASDNDKYVAQELIKNAVIAAEKVFPSCQDTGTAIVFGKKGDRVITDCDDGEPISKGVYETFTERNLRYSQMAPLTMYQEQNTKTNLPAQIDILSVPGSEYKFLFVAKGGGSANKTYLYQKTKALLNPDSMEKFVRDAITSLGTAACPPYHLAVVIGGTSAEQNVKMVKLASCGYLDEMPKEGNSLGRGFRDLELEGQIEQWARETKIGAQFGGKYFVHDVKVIRLPRHGASCPVGIGVSCSADRNIKGKITEEGIFLEKMEENPARFLPEHSETGGESTSIDLQKPMKEILETLTKLKVSSRVNLNGTIVVARDVAHAKLKERLDRGEGLPEYLKEFPIYYAGPAKTPEGFASGSFGPTTSQRMDPYVPIFQKEGASLVMLGKGNRTAEVAESCKKYGGFYLGSIGGPAALLGKECIKKVEVLEYPELGMEAIWKIEVENFPAFIIVDDKGNDFFVKR